MHSSAGYAFFGLLSILLAWKYLQRQTATGDNDLLHSLGKEIERLCPIVLIPRAFGLGFTGTVFIFFSCFNVYCAMDGLSKIAACMADDAGSYELAEQLIRMDISREAGRTSATWRTHFHPEDEKARNARNKAVAKLYGSNSLQMADRYRHLGEALSLSEKSAQLDESILWLEKSLMIYSSLGATQRSIVTLNQMAVVRDEQTGHPELKDILLQASQLLDNPTKSLFPMTESGRYASSLGGLSYYSRKAGDQRLSKIFLAKCLDIRHEGKRSSDYFWAKFIFSVLITLLALNVLPMRVNILERLMLLHQYKLAQRQFLHSTDVSTSIQGLNAMITIDLYSGKLKRAWDNSINVLRMVGIDAKEMNHNFVEPRSSFSPAMLIEPIHAALFIALFFTVFYR